MFSSSFICPNPLPITVISCCLPSGSQLIFITSCSLSCFSLQFKICTHICKYMSVHALKCACMCVVQARICIGDRTCSISFFQLWVTLLNILFSSSNHFFLKIPIFLTAEQNSTVCMYHAFFTHSSADVHQSGSQFPAGVNWAMNRDAQVPHGGYGVLRVYSGVVEVDPITFQTALRHFLFSQVYFAMFFSPFQ